MLFFRCYPPPETLTSLIGPGMYLALSSVWLACAMSLAVFDIEKYVDGFGNVVEPPKHQSTGIIR